LGGVAERNRSGIKFCGGLAQKENLFIFGADEYPHELYFDMLKITEDFLRMKMKVDNELALKQRN
jgi:hypothetical protein